MMFGYLPTTARPQFSMWLNWGSRDEDRAAANFAEYNAANKGIIEAARREDESLARDLALFRKLVAEAPRGAWREK